MGGLCFLFVLLFAYAPLAGWIIAFANYKPGMSLSQMKFAGLSNFKLLFQFTTAMRPLLNTLIFSSIGLICTPLSPIIAILLSEIKAKKYKSAIQTFITFPNFISWILVFALAIAMFSSDGVINQLLKGAGLSPVDPNGSLKAVYLYQTLLSLWKGAGFGAIIYLASLSGVDPEQYDAVDVDGGGRWAKIVHVKLPSLYPTYFTLLILQIGQFLNNGFEQYYAFNNGMVQDHIMVLDLYVYVMGISMHNYGVATAIGMMKTVVSFFLLTTANYASKRVRGEAIL